MLAIRLRAGRQSVDGVGMKRKRLLRCWTRRGKNPRARDPVKGGGGEGKRFQCRCIAGRWGKASGLRA